MITKTVYIKTAEKVKDFVNQMSRIEASADLCSHDNHYIVDAKSILGVFSLDISKPLTLNINDDEINEKNYQKLFDTFCIN